MTQHEIDRLIADYTPEAIAARERRCRWQVLQFAAGLIVGIVGAFGGMAILFSPGTPEVASWAFLFGALAVGGQWLVHHVMRPE